MSIARVPLGELMPLKKQTLDPRKNPDKEFELFSIPAFDEGAPEVVSGKDVGSSKQVLESGDVLLSKIVPHIRRAWVVEPGSDRPTIGSSEWIIFRSDRFDPAYLRHALVSDRFHQAFMKTVAGVGGSLLRARPSYVAEIEIPLPPREEQQRIAAVLDAAEALRAKRRQALAKLDALTQAVFIEMFGDAEKAVAIVPLGELMPPKRRTVDPRKTPEEEFELFSIPAYDEGAPEVVRGENIGSSKQALERDDVLLSKIVPHIRRSWIVKPGSDRPTIGSSEWIIFRSDRFEPAYLRHALVSDRFHQAFMKTVAGVGGSLLRARPSYVADIKIPLPPIGDQRQFKVTIGAIETLRAKGQLALAGLETLNTSLQQRAFRGEL